MTQLPTNTSNALAPAPLKDKQVQLLGLLLDGDPWRASLDASGYSKETRKGDILKSPAFKKAFLEGMEMQLLSSGPRAIKVLEDALEDATQAGTREKVKVATEFLDRIGLAKVERVKHEGVAVTTNVFILPPKREALSVDENSVIINVTPDV